MNSLFALDVDGRAPLIGWCGGYYQCKCKCCGLSFLGAKGAYHCADCAYAFKEQLEYERLWFAYSLPYSYEYIMKKVRLARSNTKI